MVGEKKSNCVLPGLQRIRHGIGAFGAGPRHSSDLIASECSESSRQGRSGVMTKKLVPLQGEGTSGTLSQTS